MENVVKYSESWRQCSSKRIFKYSIRHIQISGIFLHFYIRYLEHKIKNVNLLFIFIFSLYFNAVDTQLSRILKNMKYHLWEHKKGISVVITFFENFLFSHFNECPKINCETHTAFFISFILNHKRPTVTAPQFCKQAQILFYQLLN